MPALSLLLTASSLFRREDRNSALPAGELSTKILGDLGPAEVFSVAVCASGRASLGACFRLFAVDTLRERTPKCATARRMHSISALIGSTCTYFRGPASCAG